jgi:hypothetical protein
MDLMVRIISLFEDSERKVIGVRTTASSPNVVRDSLSPGPSSFSRVSSVDLHKSSFVPLMLPDISKATDMSRGARVVALSGVAPAVRVVVNEICPDSWDP